MHRDSHTHADTDPLVPFVSIEHAYYYKHLGRYDILVKVDLRTHDCHLETVTTNPLKFNLRGTPGHPDGNHHTVTLHYTGTERSQVTVHGSNQTKTKDVEERTRRRSEH